MKEKTLYILFFLIYIVLSLLLVNYHELWRDEIHTLLVINECNSIFEIYPKTRYDGHPLLWYYIVYIFKGFSIFQYQILHTIIAILGTGLFYFYSKIDFKWKVLIIFGYFFTFEYNILFRNYGLGVLFLFLSITFFQKKKIFFSVLSIFLATQSNFFALVVGSFLWIYILFHQKPKIHYKNILYSLIIGCGIIIYAYTALFLAKDHYIPTALIKLNIGVIADFFKTFGISMVNIPEPNIYFWNSYIFNPVGQFFIGIVVYFLILNYLKKEKKTFYFFLFTCMVIQLFFGIKYYGHLRHFGHLYLTLIIALWLRSIQADSKLDYSFKNNKLIIFLFLTQIYATGVSSFFEIKYNFSNSVQASKFVLNSKYSSKNLLAYPDYSTAPISFFVNRPIYCLDMKEPMTYMKYKRNRIDGYIYKNLLKDYAENNKMLDKKLLITNEHIPLQIQKEMQIKLIKYFEPAINKDENYYFYLKR